MVSDLNGSMSTLPSEKNVTARRFSFGNINASVNHEACDFEPGFISQLNMYQNVVNDILRHPDDKPTIGLLLVKGKNETVVEYSLAGYQNPIGVAEWKNQITQSLPEELQSSLPSIEEIEKELK